VCVFIYIFKFELFEIVFIFTNLLQVMKKSHEARQKLLRLGIFRHVEVVIDTAEGTTILQTTNSK